MVGGSNCTHIGCNSGQTPASSSFSSTTSLGYGTTVGAAGGVAIGTDSSNNGATTSVANQIQLGTANHTVNFPGTMSIPTGGAAAIAGTGTLAAGTVTISTTAVTANSLIFLTDTASSLTNVGTLSVSSKTAGTSFTVKSANALDTSTFNWHIIN